MKMSKNTYKKFMDIVNTITEEATDLEANYIIDCIIDASRAVVEKLEGKKNGEN